MQLAVLCSPESWYFRDLLRAADDRHEIIGVPFSKITTAQLDGKLHVSSNGFDLSSADAVLVRTMPPGTLEQVVFRMDALARLSAGGTPVVNSPRAIETAVDKLLASAKIAAAGLPHPPLVACQDWQDAMRAFDDLGRDVVVKPLFGAEGRGLARVTDEAIALRVFKTLAGLGAVIYLQQFIHHTGHDIRVFVVGDPSWGERMFAMRRSNANDWRTNVSQGAAAEPVELTDQWADLARRASRAVGTTIAGVDLLPDRDGTLYVIEVNAVPGWKALAKTLDVDIAGQVLEYLQSRVDR